MEALIIILFVLAVILLYWLKERKEANKIFFEAVSLEQKEKYEEACYVYAIALDAGSKRQICHKKILELWHKHGPFDFKKVLDEYEKDYIGEKSYRRGFTDCYVDDIQNMIKSNSIE